MHSVRNRPKADIRSIYPLILIKLLAKFGIYLRKRQNFLLYSVVAVGVPSAFGLIWMFGDGRGLGYWIFLTALAFGGAYGWGVVMWHVFAKNFSRPGDSDKFNKQG